MEQNEAAKIFAQMGGRANVKKHGKKHMKEISRLGVEARRKKKAAQNAS